MILLNFKPGRNHSPATVRKRNFICFKIQSSADNQKSRQYGNSASRQRDGQAFSFDPVRNVWKSLEKQNILKNVVSRNFFAGTYSYANICATLLSPKQSCLTVKVTSSIIEILALMVCWILKVATAQYIWTEQCTTDICTIYQCFFKAILPSHFYAK